MDKFEKHIKDNKGNFDEFEPDRSKIWNQIELHLDSKSTKVIPLWRSRKWRVAAGIAIIIGIFSLFGVLTNNTVEIAKSDSGSNEELSDVDSYYKNLVSTQVQLVKSSSKLSPEEKEEFLSFMDELDKEYLVLKNELNKNINNEAILEAIVKNYKKRIDIIENLLQQLNDSKEIKNDNEYVL